MKRRLQTFAFGFMIFVAGCVFADEPSSAYCNDCGRFTLGAELLYFKAVTDQSAFIGVSPPPTGVSESRKINNPNFRPGFRLEADWYMCGLSHQLQARYTYLYNGHKSHASGRLIPVFLSTNTAFTSFGTGEAQSHLTTVYNAGDLVWERYLFECCDFNFRFLLGLHAATVNYKENVRIALSTPVIALIKNNWKSHFWGIGPELGFIAAYAFPWFCDLSLIGEARGALLAGRTRGDVKLLNSPNNFVTSKARNKPGFWGVTPALDGRLGLNYLWCCTCFMTNFEIGYEMIWYNRAINKIAFNLGGANVGLSTDLFSDYTAHGPYAAIHVSF